MLKLGIVNNRMIYYNIVSFGLCFIINYDLIIICIFYIFVYFWDSDFNVFMKILIKLFGLIFKYI